jgi:protein involved in polysaccharide export with SLBB domain
MGAEDAPAKVSDVTKPERPRAPQMPTQFQRFVQENTGKLLPHYGAELFENPQSFAAGASQSAPAPSEYVLGTGDQIRVRLWGAIDYVGVQTIDRNGEINLPKIGTVALAGTQVKDLEGNLRKQVATVFTNVTVSAGLGRLRGVTVYVVGLAQNPGAHNLTSLSTLVNAIFASGGPTLSGSMRNIMLKRGGKTVTTLDLYDFISDGDKSKDVVLQPGDVISIPPAGPRVAVAGAYDHAAIYEIKPGTTVKDVLALGGGVPTLAATQKALIERIDGSQKSPRQVNDLVLNTQGLSQSLQDGDILTLLAISPAFANAVTLQGNVAQPLRHKWFAGMRVQDLIPDREALITPDYYKRKNQLVQNPTANLRAQGLTPEQIQLIDKAQKQPQDMTLATEVITRGGPSAAATFGGAAATPTASVSGGGLGTLGAGSRISLASTGQSGLTQEINWDYAVVERLNKIELRTELIPFNLAKAIVQKDPDHNLQLQPGDVVTIMSSADLRLPTERQTRLIRIDGEVLAPGVYQALPGETLPQILQRVGGLTPQAYLYGAEFTRETVRRQQQQNLDQLIRRLEAQQQSATATVTANLTVERSFQSAALQQQQQQQLKSQIERLKTMRSKGRVALELDPDKALQCQEKPLSAKQQCANNLRADLPNLPLEDGDAFHVPSVPAFVAAAGSVNNENVVVYKTGKTVGDVIKSAGVTEDAEMSEAFVLRADGSIVGRAASGFFGTFNGTKVMPGDTVVVPSKIDRESTYNFAVRALKDWTMIISNLGIGAAAIKTLSN